MKIAIVSRYLIQDIRGGGQEVTMDVYARYLSDFGHDVHVIAYDTSKHKLSTEIVKKGYTIYRVKGIRSIFTSRMLGFYRLLRKIRPDIIVMSSYSTSMHGYFLGRLVGCKVISIAHDEFDVYGFRKPFNIIHYLNRRFTKKMDCVISVNNNIKDVLEKETGIKTPVIYTGFDIPEHPKKEVYRFYQSEKHGKPFVFVYMGRISKEKGLDYLLQAFMMFLEKYDNSKCIIIGDGKYLEELKRKYISPKIEYKGYVEEEKVLDILCVADAFLNATYIKEGVVFSNIMAMKMGVPVIATDTGASSEAIQNLWTGMLVTPKNPEDMFKSMEHIANYPEHAEFLAKNALNSSKMFSGNEATLNLEKILNDIAG